MLFFGRKQKASEISPTVPPNHWCLFVCVCFAHLTRLVGPHPPNQGLNLDRHELPNPGVYTPSVTSPSGRWLCGRPRHLCTSRAPPLGRWPGQALGSGPTFTAL